MANTQSTSQPQLTLVYVPGRYAVCRFLADSKPPPWCWKSKFYSLTKTEDELSIVCEEETIPSDILTGEKCETGWQLLKVQGPLDFGLTGILNSLTNPLGKAGVSLFAVSTYDTDYILVKEDRLFDANYAFVSAGHKVERLPENRQPWEGRIVTFEKDPMIKRMIKLKRGNSSVEESFGLVICAGWVPSEAVQTCYNEKFLPAVQRCFQESDWKDLVSDDIPRVYFYPSGALHVTVATLHAFTRPEEESPPRELLIKEWTDLVEAASCRVSWPKKPLQLSLDSAQIGKRAGILLWKELTGGIDQMRVCIKAEADAREDHLRKLDIDPDTLSIPDIIHSSFVRYHEIPETPGEEIQERFQKLILERISTFFPDPLVVPQVKFVCERRPYMHITDDERHVFLDLELRG